MKTNKMFIGVLLLTTVLTVKAQTSNTQPQDNSSVSPTGYAIAINLGSSTPLGSFSDRAETGLNFNLSSEIPIKHSHFGIAIMLGGQSNTYNTQAYMNASGLSSATASGSIISDNLLVGGFATIPVHRFSFDFRLMVGSMICEYPNLTATDYYGTYYQINVQSSEKVGAIDLGAGVRYNLSSKLTLMLNWNYISGAAATFNVTSTATNYQYNYYQTLSQTESRTFSFFNATWGLGWII